MRKDLLCLLSPDTIFESARKNDQFQGEIIQNQMKASFNEDGAKTEMSSHIKECICNTSDHT